MLPCLFQWKPFAKDQRNFLYFVTKFSFATYPSSGENDLRATYCAFVLSHLLNAWDAIDVPRAIDFIQRCRVRD